jgi:hypothetical protein
MAAIKYIILFAICFPSFGQGQGVDGGGGPPKTVLNRILDTNGNWRHVDDLNQDIKREFDYETILRNIGRTSGFVTSGSCDEGEIEAFKLCDNRRVLEGVLDINTRDHGLIDTETLRDLSPQWMEERNGEIWVDPRAPITDYQTSDGEIKPF